MSIDINIKPYLDNIKSQITAAATSELTVVQKISMEYMVDAEQRLTDLAQGAASGELSYAKVIKSLKEETTNLYDFALSVASITAADAENLAKTIIAEFKIFLEDQIEKQIV